MTPETDIAIIGGGAAGLAAAIFAAEACRGQRRVVILDGAASLGAKILVSGGGRCNVTHDVVRPEDFNGARPVVRNVLAAFPAPAAVKWFESMGVQLKREETGKLFPVADSARVVLDALVGRCGELGVTIQCGCRVKAISPPSESDHCFVIEHDAGDALSPSPCNQGEGRGGGSSSSTRSDKATPTLTLPLGTGRGDEDQASDRVAPRAGVLHASRVIMATGGRSLPRSGSDGSGWDIVRRLGHRVTPTFAGLAPLVLDAGMFHAGLSGIAQAVQLATFVDGQLVDRRRGSLLWTHFGISGPVVMDASRYWVMAHESGKAARMECNLLPGDDFEAIERWLVDQAASRGRTSIASILATRLPERVARAVIVHGGIDPAVACAQLSRANRRELVRLLTALPLPVVRHRGWNYAEVTAGGVPLEEINFRTMESRKVPGLYLIGEMLDCDGRIGGFNFQWAWSTGHIAGKAAAGQLLNK